MDIHPSSIRSFYGFELLQAIIKTILFFCSGTLVFGLLGWFGNLLSFVYIEHKPSIILTSAMDGFKKLKIQKSQMEGKKK